VQSSRLPQHDDRSWPATRAFEMRWNSRLNENETVVTKINRYGSAVSVSGRSQQPRRLQSVDIFLKLPWLPTHKGRDPQPVDEQRDGFNITIGIVTINLMTIDMMAIMCPQPT
jgi:hypothetical protein